MKALVKMREGPGNLEVIEAPEPVPGPGEVVVRVAYCGVCGTDLRIQDGLYHMKPPVIPGHEVSGVIESAGTGVEGIAAGQAVSCETIVNQCGRCVYCLEGNPQICPSHLGMGTRYNGGFAEYVLIPKENVYALPEGISLEEGALVEPLACATHAVFGRFPPPPGSSVLVLGPGPIGLMVSRLCSICGARVVMCGLKKDARRLALAGRYGARASLSLEDPGAEAGVRELSGGAGYDVVYECAGGGGGALRSALDLVRKGGAIVQVGVLDGEPALPLGLLVEKQLTVVGTKSQNPKQWTTALRLIGEREIDLKPLVGDIYPLEQWREAFEHARSGAGLKTLIRPMKSAGSDCENAARAGQ